MQRMLPLLVGALAMLLALPAVASSVVDDAVVAQAPERAQHVASSAEGKAVRGEQVKPAAQSSAVEKRLQHMLAPQGIALLTLRPMERRVELTTVSRR